MQGDDDISVVSASEGTHIGEKAPQGTLGLWLKQFWKWGSGNEGVGAPNTGLHISVSLTPPPLPLFYHNCTCRLAFSPMQRGIVNQGDGRGREREVRGTVLDFFSEK